MHLQRNEFFIIYAGDVRASGKWGKIPVDLWVMMMRLWFPCILPLSDERRRSKLHFFVAAYNVWRPPEK